MKKNDLLIYSSIGLTGLFLLYYYNKKGSKKFVNAVGGYDCERTHPTTSCNSVERCSNIKVTQIVCDIKNNDKQLYNRLKNRAAKINAPLENLILNAARNIFTNNGQRNKKQSLDHFGITVCTTCRNTQRLRPPRDFSTTQTVVNYTPSYNINTPVTNPFVPSGGGGGSTRDIWSMMPWEKTNLAGSGRTVGGY